MQKFLGPILLTLFCLSALFAGAGAEEQKTLLLEFPKDQSYGQILVMPKTWNPINSAKSTSKELYEARGTLKFDRTRMLCMLGSYALGQHPQVLKKLPAEALTKLDLGKLEIESPALANVSHLTGLRCLDLDGTDVDDQAIKFIKPLKNLRFLSISHTLLKGSTLGDLACIPTLERLHISHCTLDPKQIGGLSQLKQLLVLHVFAGQIDDNNLEFISHLTRLTDLSLAGNQGISDRGVKKLACLKKLRDLDLTDARISEAGILSLKGLPLENLRLHNTRITFASRIKLSKAFPRCQFEFSKTPHAPMEVFEPLH